MGQATRTTKLLLDLEKRDQGGANTDKRAALDATVWVLNEARAFYIDFFLAHAEKLAERVAYYSEKHLEMRERSMSPHELLTWAESCTVTTKGHPNPWTGWNFSERFPDMPFVYRRAAIKDAIGKARSYLSNHANWEKSGKTRGKPGLPGAANHPTLYKGTVELDLSGDGKEHARFVRLKVYTGTTWQWYNYPLKNNRYFQQRLSDPAWEQQSPKLVLRKTAAELHFSQTREISAKYPGCVLVFERLRKIRPKGGSKSRRMNRKQANQLRGKINQRAREKAFVLGVVTAETNSHGTSQYCSRCGARGERFSNLGGKCVTVKWGKLFRCPVCQYEVQADFNASCNLHHSFYQERHWQPRRLKRSG